QIADRLFAFEKVEEGAKRLSPVRFKLRVAFDDHARIVMGGREEVFLRLDVGYPEARQTALPRTEQFARAPQSQVFLGDPETIFRFTHDLDPRLGGFAKRRLVEQETTRFVRAAADTATQLMKLGKAEPFRMLNDHDGRGRYIDADLDDRGGNEYLDA